jgi:hypothetical protein
MAAAYASADPQYQAKAAVWLIDTHGRAGNWDLVERISTAVNPRIGPTLQPSATTHAALRLPLWRAQLLATDTTPPEALDAAHGLHGLHGLMAYDRPGVVPSLLQHLHADLAGRTADRANPEDGAGAAAGEP